MEKGEQPVGCVSHVDEASAMVEDDHDSDDEGIGRRRSVSVMDHLTAVQMKQNSMKSGFLLKQSGGFQRWKRVHVIITGRKLLLARTEDAKVRDEINLTNSTVAERSVKNINHCFAVFSATEMLILQAESRKSMEEWLSAFKSAVKFARERDNTLTDHLQGHHQWHLKSFKRQAFCNVCRQPIHGVGVRAALACGVCQSCVHRSCALHCPNNCKWTSSSSMLLEAANKVPTQMPHQWMEGNLPLTSQCMVCKKSCGSTKRLQDWRCLWCRHTVHDDCRSLLTTDECSLGQLMLSILPPTHVYISPDGSFYEASHPHSSSPLLAFVNSKSGDNQGVRFMRRLQRLLNPAQVFDLQAGGPLPGLRLFQLFPNFRVLICGGDGTIGWVMTEVDKLGLHSKCQYATLPLGTGNDLARVLGWGSSCDDNCSLVALLQEYEQCRVKMLDRWSIFAEPSVKELGGSNPPEDWKGSISMKMPRSSVINLAMDSEEQEKDPNVISATLFHDRVETLFRAQEDVRSYLVKLTVVDVEERAKILAGLSSSVHDFLGDIETLASASSCSHKTQEHCVKLEEQVRTLGATIASQESHENVIAVRGPTVSPSLSTSEELTSESSERKSEKPSSSKVVAQVPMQRLTQEISQVQTTIDDILRAFEMAAVVASRQEITDDSPQAQESPTVEVPQVCMTLLDSDSLDSPEEKDSRQAESGLLPENSRPFIRLGSLCSSNVSQESLSPHPSHTSLSVNAVGSIRTDSSQECSSFPRLAASFDSGLGTIVSPYSSCLGVSASSGQLSRTSDLVSIGQRRSLDPESPQTPDNEITVMNNYFGIGLDAKVSLDFHQMREEHPEKCRSRLKNIIWYGMYAGREMVQRTTKSLSKRLQVECDGRLINLPRAQGLVILNIPSYMAGVNFWGTKENVDGFDAPALDDRLIEVVAVVGPRQMATSKVLGIQQQHNRVAQCRHVRITISGTEPVPIQVDGEAWMQAPGELVITYKNRAQMLVRDKSFAATLRLWKRSSTEVLPGPTFQQARRLQDDQLEHVRPIATKGFKLLEHMRVLLVGEGARSQSEQCVLQKASTLELAIRRLFPDHNRSPRRDFSQVYDLIFELKALMQESTWLIQDRKFDAASNATLQTAIDELRASVADLGKIEGFHFLESSLSRPLLTDSERLSDCTSHSSRTSPTAVHLSVSAPQLFSAPNERSPQKGSTRKSSRYRLSKLIRFNFRRSSTPASPLANSPKQPQRLRSAAENARRAETITGPVRGWSSTEVRVWSDNYQLGDFAEVVDKHALTGADLASLDKRRLKELGLRNTSIRQVVSALHELPKDTPKVEETSSPQSPQSSDTSRRGTSLRMFRSRVSRRAQPSTISDSKTSGSPNKSTLTTSSSVPPPLTASHRPLCKTKSEPLADRDGFVLEEEISGRRSADIALTSHSPP